MRVTPGMRASVAPREGHIIREMRKGAPSKRILHIGPGYVVVVAVHSGNYSVLRRKTLWRYVVVEAPVRSLPVRITVAHDATGEVREWSMSDAHLKLIHRALTAHKRVPAYVAERFEFARPRGRGSFIGGVPQSKRARS